MSLTSKPEPVCVSSMRCSSSAAVRSTASRSPDRRSSPPRATSCVPLSFSTSFRFWSWVPKSVSWSMPAREMERRMADVSVGGMRVIECSPARFGESSRFAGPVQPQMEVRELVLPDGRGRAFEERARAGRLRERDDLAQALGAREQHGDTVQPDRDAAVRRSAVLQGLEQKAELRLRLFALGAEHLEHALLHGALVNADRPAAKLVAVEDEIVGQRRDLQGIGRAQRLDPAARRGEGVVAGCDAPALALLEQWKVDDPDE